MLCNENENILYNKQYLQREQEYAEARKRILGEEKSPEEKLEQEISRIQPKSITPSGSGLPNNILRMPIGPDGTRGFNVRRQRVFQGSTLFTHLFPLLPSSWHGEERRL